MISSHIDDATISPNMTSPEPTSLVSVKRHSKCARQLDTSGASITEADESSNPHRSIRSRPCHRKHPKTVSAMEESTKLTAKHPISRILLSVLFPLVPENMRMGGVNETIESQLFGATFGSLSLLNVDMSTTGPGMRLGDHLCLSMG